MSDIEEKIQYQIDEWESEIAQIQVNITELGEELTKSGLNTDKTNKIHIALNEKTTIADKKRQEIQTLKKIKNCPISGKLYYKCDDNTYHILPKAAINPKYYLQKEALYLRVQNGSYLPISGIFAIFKEGLTWYALNSGSKKVIFPLILESSIVEEIMSETLSILK